MIKPVDFDRDTLEGEVSSKVVQRKVEAARIRQYERYGKELCNSRVGYDVLQKTSPLTQEQQKIIHQLAVRKNWSNRTQIKIIRLARTISDLEGKTAITDQSIWEAVKLR